VALLIIVAAWQNRDRTVYAPGFSEAKFRTIRLGMAKKDVLRILGNPMSIDSATGYIDWTYPKNRLCPDEPSSVEPNVTFRANVKGKIEAVYGDCSSADPKRHELVGHFLQELRKRLGEPERTLTVPDREYYWYSEMKNIKDRYIRGIVINDMGITGSIEAGRVGHYFEVDGVRPSPSNWIEWLEWNL
jgi:hypothetical protein